MRENWTFLTTHALLLIAIADEPDARMRDLAARVNVTERAVFDLIEDLSAAGYVTKVKVGRRVHYRVHEGKGLRRPGTRGEHLLRLLEIIEPSDGRSRS